MQASPLSESEISQLKQQWHLAKLVVYTGGYYAASGKVDGHKIEMYITEERMQGCLPGLSSYVRMKVDGNWKGGAMALDGRTASMADALRREHPGSTRLLSDCEIESGLNQIRALI